MARAEAVNDDPLFLDMMADVVLKTSAAVRIRPAAAYRPVRLTPAVEFTSVPAQHPPARAESAQVTRGNGRRVEGERFDRRRRAPWPSVMCGVNAPKLDFSRKRSTHEHVADAPVSFEERVRVRRRFAPGPERLHQPLVQIEKLRRPFDRHPQCVTALAAAGDRDAQRALTCEHLVDMRKRDLEFIVRDEVLRQRDVRKVIGVEPQTLRPIVRQCRAQRDCPGHDVGRRQNRHVECHELRHVRM